MNHEHTKGNKVCWQVRDAHGCWYGTYSTHGDAMHEGRVLAERLNWPEVRVTRIVVPLVYEETA